MLRHARCVSCAGERSRLLLRACGPLQRQSNARSTQDGANRRSILDTGTTGALLRMGARRFGICNPKMRVSGDDATVWSGRLHANRSLSSVHAKSQAPRPDQIGSAPTALSRLLVTFSPGLRALAFPTSSLPSLPQCSFASYTSCLFGHLTPTT